MILFLFVEIRDIFHSYQQEVDQATAAAYAENIGAMYIETSAKDDLHVQNLFVQISKYSDFFLYSFTLDILRR